MFTTAARGVLFIYSTPFFVALGAHWLFPAERLHGTKIAGLIAAFAGLSLAFADGLRLPTRREVLGDVLQLGGRRPLGDDDPHHQGARADDQPAPDALLPAGGLGGAPRRARGGERRAGRDAAHRAGRGRGALPDRHPRLRELPRLVLAAHPLPGLASARVHVLDAPVRGACRLAPAGRSGHPGARPRHGVRGAGDLPRQPAAGRRCAGRRGPATARAGAAGPGGRTGGGSPRSAAASGSAPCRRGPGARGTR